MWEKFKRNYERIFIFEYIYGITLSCLISLTVSLAFIPFLLLRFPLGVVYMIGSLSTILHLGIFSTGEVGGELWKKLHRDVGNEEEVEELSHARYAILSVLYALLWPFFLLLNVRRFIMLAVFTDEEAKQEAEDFIQGSKGK